MNVGDAVIYVNTGTKGIIEEIKREGREVGGKTWALLDNGLYYDILFLEPATLKDRSETKDISIEEVESKLKEKADMLSKVDMDEGDIGGG
ncbi:MAG: hypothetical protein MASP_00806 [Candidatus Methanolliviera sp. GoM_asphalt]|nr:MAG: hypothetical protein MASP_00806 [Candidatus Methanolliviera sp. GoM_asphalt]